VTGDARDPAARLADWGGDAGKLFASARDPAKAVTAVVTFHKRVDEVLEISIAGRGVKVACARGCSYCCHLRVEVQPLEAFTLAAWLRRTASTERLAAVIAKLRANVERSRALGAEARKRTNLACALLGEDGACTAYEARPSQCRRYHSTSIDPAATSTTTPRGTRSTAGSTMPSLTTPT
jgi:hypothetical protein